MTDDPMEGLIRSALLEAGIRFKEGDKNAAGLDFYLRDFGIYIEVKQFHSDRIAEQMGRAPNVIAVQGRRAVELLAAMIARPPGPMVTTPDFDFGNGGSSPPEAANA